MRQRAGMVLLHVVRHDVLDARGVHHLAHALDELVGERGLARVDERGLLVHDEVGVVRGPPVRRVAVEVPLVPIDAPDPVHVRLYLDRMQHGRLLPLSVLLQYSGVARLSEGCAG